MDIKAILRRAAREAFSAKVLFAGICSLVGAIGGTLITWAQLVPQNNVKILPVKLIPNLRVCKINKPALEAILKEDQSVVSYGQATNSSPDLSLRLYAFVQRINKQINIPQSAIEAQIVSLQTQLSTRLAAVAREDGNEGLGEKKNKWKTATADFFCKWASTLSSPPIQGEFPAPLRSEVGAILDNYFDQQFETYHDKLKSTPALAFVELARALIRQRGDAQEDFFVSDDQLPSDESQRTALVGLKVLETDCAKAAGKETERSVRNGFVLDALVSMGRQERYGVSRDCVLRIDNRINVDVQIVQERPERPNIPGPKPAGVESAWPDVYDSPVTIFSDSEFIKLHGTLDSVNDADKNEFENLVKSAQDYQLSVTCRTFRRSVWGFPAKGTTQIGGDLVTFRGADFKEERGGT